MGLAIVLLFFFYHPPTFDLLHERKTKRQLLKKLDCEQFPSFSLEWQAYVCTDAGIFMWTAGLTLLLMGISLGGTIFPWNSAAVISTILIGAVLLIALFFYESYANLEYPAIPVKFFANRGFMSLVVCATVASVSISSRAPSMLELP